MVVPASSLTHRLPAQGTKTPLSTEEAEDLPSITQLVLHPLDSQRLPLQFVLCVIGGVIPRQTFVAHDCGSRQFVQLAILPFSLAILVGVRKHPVLPTYGSEVFIPDPFSRLLRMPALRPPPDSPENQIVQLAEGLLCHDWGMVLRPPLQYRIQMADQRFLRQSPAAFNDLAHLPIERRGVFLRGLDQQIGLPTW